jgi:hypothetical protein
MSFPSEQFEFATTLQSVMLRAARPDDSAARSALELHCRRFWFATPNARIHLSNTDILE